MMATITHPDKCFFARSALGAWPKLLPQLAAFVSCSKVYKATNWGWHELSFASKQLLQMGTHAFELQRKVAAAVPKGLREGNDLMQIQKQQQRQQKKLEEEQRKQKQQRRQQRRQHQLLKRVQHSQHGAKQQLDQQQRQQAMAAAAEDEGAGQQQGNKEQHNEQGEQQQQQKKEAGEQVFQLLGDLSWVGMHLMNAGCGPLADAALLAPQITAHMLSSNGVRPEVPEDFLPKDPEVLLRFKDVIDDALIMKAGHLDQATKAREAAAAAAAAGGDPEDAGTVTQRYQPVKTVLAPLVAAGVVKGGIKTVAAVLEGRVKPEEAADILAAHVKHTICIDLKGDRLARGEGGEAGAFCSHASSGREPAAAARWAATAELAGVTAAVARARARREAAGVAAPAGAAAATQEAAAALAPDGVSAAGASDNPQGPSLAAVANTRLGSDAISDLSGLFLHALLTSAVGVESLVERFGVQRLQKWVESEKEWLAEVDLPQRQVQLMACSLFLQHADAQHLASWQPSLGQVLVEAATALQDVAQGSLGWAPSPNMIIDGVEGEGTVPHMWVPKSERAGQEGVVLGVLRMAVGPALQRVPAGFCCYNPACSNLQGLSELGLMPAIARRFDCGGSSSSSSSGPGRSSRKGGGVCGGCKRVWYCSRACQKQNWMKHKAMCGAFAAKGSRGQMSCVCIKTPAASEGRNGTRCINVMSFSD